MAETTLAELEKRVAELERVTKPLRLRASEGWRSVLGMFKDSEITREVNEECRRVRETERAEARLNAES